MLQNIMAEKDKIMRNAPLKAFASPLKAKRPSKKTKIEAIKGKEIKEPPRFVGWQHKKSNK